MRLKAIVLAVCLSLSAQAFAGSGIPGNMSTETTQLANNAELVASYAKQAEGVMVEINQYITMLTNLKQLPLVLVGAALGPYKSQLKDVMKVYKAVQEVQKAAGMASGIMNRRLGEMSSMNLSPSQYSMYEIQLATQKGGAYKAQLDHDMEAMRKLQERSEALSNMSDKIGDIEGNVQGLQHLASVSHQVAGETAEINRNLLIQRDIALQEKVNQADRDAAQNYAETLRKMKLYATTNSTALSTSSGEIDILKNSRESQCAAFHMNCD